MKNQHSTMTGATPTPAQAESYNQTLASLIARRATPLVIASSFALGGAVQSAEFAPTSTEELIQAMTVADSNGEDDRIDLGGNTFTLTATNNTDFIYETGNNGLPVVSESQRRLTITNGTITRDPAAVDNFRILQIFRGTSVLENVTISGGNAIGFGQIGTGGGIFQSFGALALVNSTVSGNTARNIPNDEGEIAVARGGGIYSSGYLRLFGSTISGNTATDGGGLNTAIGSTILVNSTISGNTAVSNSGTADGTANGSAITAFGRDLYIYNSTIAGNTVVSNFRPGFPYGTIFASRPTRLVFSNSLIANNNQLNCFGNAFIRSEGVNFTDDISQCTYAGFTYDPAAGTLLGDLASNGGPTLTHALLPGNPAIDAAGDNVSCIIDFEPLISGLPGPRPPPEIDQRGVPRPLDGDNIAGAACDVGAFELMPEATPISDLGDAPAPYPTLMADNGAAHVVQTSADAWLGAVPDAEADGQPNADATGDDNNGEDDEDGVNFPELVQGETASITVTIGGMPDANSETTLLNAWMDFNADGDWDDDGEQIIENASGLVSGDNSINVNIPADATLGTSFARFRIYTGDVAVEAPPAITPGGVLDSGEVEDYAITIVAPPQPSADLAISVTDTPDPVPLGETLTYTVNISNNGPLDAINVRVNSTLPGEVTFVSTSGCAEDPSGAPACSLGSIPSGGGASFSITTTAPNEAIEGIAFEATVSSDTDDLVVGNNTAMEASDIGFPPGTLFCNGLPATIIGTEAGDKLNGTGGDDVILGLGGSDRINGRGGDDTICGGEGNDVISGGSGNDTIFGEGGSDRIDGNGGADTLSGDRGNDIINGGGGNDMLNGGDGSDRLTGGGGNNDVCDGGAGNNRLRSCEN